MLTIGRRIRSRREELGLSQDELAQRLGYKSRSSINKIELDQRNLTQPKIKAIADALDTTPSYIMGWDETGLSHENKRSVNTAGLNTLQDLRRSRGLSMKDTAQALGLPYTTYVNYEKGTREPNLETLQLLASFYGVSVDHLLGKADVPLPGLAPDEISIIEKYRSLDPRGQSAVLAILEHEYKSMSK